MVEPPTVVLAELVAQGSGFVQDRVENATPAVEPTPLPSDPALGFLKELAENNARISLGGQSDAIRAACEGMSLVAEFEGRKSGERCRDLGHQLIDRDGVAFGGADLSAGQPNRAAVVVMAQTVRMIKPADRREVGAMAFERLERARKAIVTARLGDLKIDRVDAIGKVDEHAAFGPLSSVAGEKGPHAIEERQGHRDARTSQQMPTADQPALGKDLSHDRSP